LLRRSAPRLLAAGRNNYGQLGDGTTQDRFDFVAIPGMSDVVAISGDVDFTLALRHDGTVWAWGRNDLGQLGDGTLNDLPTPGRVGRLRKVVAIAAGRDYGLALDDAGRITG
jgi:alpha-tubulin suppressor-like RCC1 family protein